MTPKSRTNADIATSTKIARPTWINASPRSLRILRLSKVMNFELIESSRFLSLRRLHVRCVGNATVFELATDLVVATDKALLQRRQRRHLVRVERTDQLRRDQHHQFGLFSALRIGAEQAADDRQFRQTRYLCHVILRKVAQQPGNGERLPVAEFHLCFSP